jgi:hypothetical protein
MSPTISVVFDYYGSKMPSVNPAWLELLTKSANSPGGLMVVPEPQPPG